MFIVSKAGPKVRERTLEWFEHIGFHDHTGIPPTRVHFARHNADKAVISKRLGLTHFVDDALGVLAHLDTGTHHYLFLGGQRADRPTPEAPGCVTSVDSWDDLQRELTASVA